ncbi:cupin domain-containing protein [Actibacterium mucosum]|uniref:hypothetical protein n=1 Tax=Actibacterium mucosum TaxID=1087332 RepID=UPI001267EB29|nr:hypothetical protein [Actibacterium mucosum]
MFGEGGTTIRLETGDAAVLPAGVSHQMVAMSDDNLVVGGYPGEGNWDNMRVAEISAQAYDDAVERIAALPVPARDPVTGGPMGLWSA